MPLPQENRRYTYEDWLTWPDDERWELIDGVPYAMAPPSIRHQTISGNIFAALHQFLRGKPCKVFAAPVGARLSATENTVIEPDIMVVCDSTKLDGKVCNGPPDLVVEILSLSTARHDRITKLNKYRDAGVREYWIADPDTNTVLVCAFETGIMKGYTDDDTAPVTVLPGCEIILSDVFAE